MVVEEVRKNRVDVNNVPACLKPIMSSLCIPFGRKLSEFKLPSTFVTRPSPGAALKYSHRTYIIPKSLRVSFLTLLMIAGCTEIVGVSIRADESLLYGCGCRGKSAMSLTEATERKQNRTSASTTVCLGCEWEVLVSGVGDQDDDCVVSIRGEHKAACGTNMVSHHLAVDAFTSHCIVDGLSRRKPPGEVASTTSSIASTIFVAASMKVTLLHLSMNR